MRSIYKFPDWDQGPPCLLKEDDLAAIGPTPDDNKHCYARRLQWRHVTTAFTTFLPSRKGPAVIREPLLPRDIPAGLLNQHHGRPRPRSEHVAHTIYASRVAGNSFVSNMQCDKSPLVFELVLTVRADVMAPPWWSLTSIPNNSPSATPLALALSTLLPAPIAIDRIENPRHTITTTNTNTSMEGCRTRRRVSSIQHTFRCCRGASLGPPKLRGRHHRINS